MTNVYSIPDRQIHALDRARSSRRPIANDRRQAWKIFRAQGPALIVARHYHHLYDGLALFAAIHRPFHIVVTLDWVPNQRAKFFLKRPIGWPAGQQYCVAML